jgi:hypothetical protein
MPRRSKFSSQKQEAICRALLAGATNAAAAEAAGVDYSTFKRWMARNFTFRAAIVRARAMRDCLLACPLSRGYRDAGTARRLASGGVVVETPPPRRMGRSTRHTQIRRRDAYAPILPDGRAGRRRPGAPSGPAV